MRITSSLLGEAGNDFNFYGNIFWKTRYLNTGAGGESVFKIGGVDFVNGGKVIHVGKKNS